MKTIKLLILASLLAAAPLYGGTHFGFSNETVGKNFTFRLGSQTSQGLAIRLSHDKLQQFKGLTISEMRTVFGSKNATDGLATLFIATDPTNPLMTQTVSISSANKWVDYSLDTPYVVTGDESELFVGYTLEIGAQYGPLSADFSQDAQGISYALASDGWHDLYGKGYGCANIEVVFSDEYSASDILLKNTSIAGYNRVGEPLSCPLQLINIGTTTLQSCSVQVSVDQQTTLDIELTDLAVAPHQIYDIQLPEIAAAVAGNGQISYNVTAVNGAEDIDPSDNLQVVDAFFYPADMQRNILLEVFTGQTCSNCPTGHNSLQSAIAQTGLPVIEVCHHSGYVADAFSMQEDWDILGLYNGVTYAPAGMVNRTTVEGNTAPVFDVNSVSGNVKALQAVSDEEPYVSIAVDAPYDASTGLIDLTTSIYTHRLPADQTELRYTLYLVQDSIIAFQQSGGAEYVHQAVCRGCITEGAWGEAVELVPGNTLSLHKSVVLPDTIISTYYTKEDGKNHIAVDLDNMYIVALVHQYSATGIGHNRVLNAAAVRVGKSYKPGGFPTETTDNRRLTRQTFYGDAQGYESLDTPTRTVDYFYNAAGNVSRAVETSKYVGLDQWGLTHYYIYDYNDAGLLARTYSWQYGSFDYGELGFFAARDTICYEYNESNQLILERHPLSYYIYTYDELGRCVQKSTWDINNISGEETNGLIETYSDFNDQGNPRQVLATSPEGKSWNEYTGTYDYDALGHLIAIRHYSSDEGLLCYAEYWDYEGDFLTAHRVPVVWADGTEEEAQREDYEMVDGNPNCIRCTMPETGNYSVSQYAEVYAADVPLISVTAVEEQINTLQLSVSLPAGSVGADIYRDGMLIAENVTGQYVDEALVNGTYEYLAVSHNAASNLAVGTVHVDLPVVTGLRAVSSRKDMVGNNYITVAWNQPEIDPALGFERNDLMLANMQTSELTTDDPSVTEFEVNLGIEEEITCYILSVYKYGKVASAQITTDIHSIGDEAISTITEEANSSIQIYDLQGRPHAGSSMINVSRNGKMLIIKQ